MNGTGQRLLTDVATLDGLIDAHEAQLGNDLAGYRNHAYRVLNLCVDLSGADARMLERIAIAAALHDLGIWTAGTFDYLQPSVGLAVTHLKRVGKDTWIPEVSEMILQHHKLSRYSHPHHSLVEPFRRADWIDVSMGRLRFGVSSARASELFAMWPSAGFHKRLVELELKRLRTHPWNPLPMMRL